MILALPLLLLGSTFAGTTFTGSSFGPPVVATTVTASLVASRVSGPAPLGVHFDATATTDSDGATTDPFRQLGYAFDAGDGNTATYSLTGQLKRRHRGGPLFAYVYETPGTYTAMVRAQNANGDYDDAEVSITVTDPDVVYATTDTICVSPTSAFGNCPSGATTTTTLPARTAYTDKRVLLHRGESFGTIATRNDQADFQVGAYGTGAKPIVTEIAVNDQLWDGTVGAHPERVAVYDLDLGTANFTTPTTFEHFTALRIEAGAAQGGPTDWYIDNPPSGWAASDFYYSRFLFLVDSVFGSGTAGGNFFYAVQSGVMGNTFHSDCCNPGAHALRIWASGRGYFGDNLMGRTFLGSVIPLKLHAGGITVCDWSARVVGTTGPECASRKVVMARNTYGDVTNLDDWLYNAKPQNEGDFADEGLEDVISEVNTFVRNGATSMDFIMVGRRMTGRQHAVSGGGTVNTSTLSTSDGDCGNFFSASPSLPHEWCGPYFLEDSAPPQPDYPQ